VSPTDRGDQILEFIGAYMAREGYPPTVREIGAAVGLRSPATVHSHLRSLQKTGRLVVVARGGHVKTMQVQAQPRPHQRTGGSS